MDEGDATTAYTVSLSPSGVTPTSDLTVSYGTANGTATAGSDYTTKSGSLTFTNTAAGSQTFTVQTTGDDVDEGTGETFTVSISSPLGGGGPAPSLGTSSVSTTITDDDDAPTGITLSANPNSLGEDDSATSVTVTATLNGSTLPSDTVVTIGTLSGTAAKDTDYTATTLASIAIPANSTSWDGEAMDHDADGRHGGRGRRDHRHPGHHHGAGSDRNLGDRHADRRQQDHHTARTTRTARS